MSAMLGVADFDLAKYANDEKLQEDKLPLKNCTIDPNGYIEIHIKSKVDGGLAPNPMAGTPSARLNSSFLRMPTIHETENECDTKDEIERKEKEYQKKL